ncbi:MAG: hypothetical protein EP330_00675 [Deltaproteobacteria bacterium]|nr:MAG: hypothetical protein EP330_00675 [Deltaproteobacteria bacterium]
MQLSPALLALVAGAAVSTTGTLGAGAALVAHRATVAVEAPAAPPALIATPAAPAVEKAVAPTVSIDLPEELPEAFANDPCPACGRG